MNDTQMTGPTQEQEQPTQIFPESEPTIMEYFSEEEDDADAGVSGGAMTSNHPHDNDDAMHNSDDHTRSLYPSPAPTDDAAAVSSNADAQEGGQSVMADPNRPCERWGHTMNFIDGNKILVYGGQTFDEKENRNKTLKDLHVYDMETKVWSKPMNCEGMPRCWVR